MKNKIIRILTAFVFMLSFAADVHAARKPASAVTTAGGSGTSVNATGGTQSGGLLLTTPTIKNQPPVVTVQEIVAANVNGDNTGSDPLTNGWARETWNDLPNDGQSAMTVGSGIDDTQRLILRPKIGTGTSVTPAGSYDQADASPAGESMMLSEDSSGGMEEGSGSGSSAFMAGEGELQFKGTEGGIEPGGSSNFENCMEALNNNSLCQSLAALPVHIRVIKADALPADLNPNNYPQLDQSIEIIAKAIDVRGSPAAIEAAKNVADDYSAFVFDNASLANVAALPDDNKVSTSAGTAWALDPANSNKPFMAALKDANIYSTASNNTFDYWNGSTPAAVPDNGSRKVIAILDTAIECTDPDLYMNMQVNQTELPAAFKAGADSNGNGYVSVSEVLTATGAANPQVLLANQAAYPMLFDGIDAVEPLSAAGVGNGIVDDIMGINYIVAAGNPPNNNPCIDPANPAPPTHATRAASIMFGDQNNGDRIAGVAARQGRFYPVRVAMDNGVSSSATFIQAVNDLYLQPFVFGIYSAANYPVDSTGLLAATLNLFKDSTGIPGLENERIVVAPAGNTGVLEYNTMAGLNTVLGVSGITKNAAGNDIAWPGSSKIPGIDVAGYVKQYADEPGNNSGYGADGTSWAAATLAGLYISLTAYVEQYEQAQVPAKDTLWRAPHFYFMTSLTAQPMSNNLLPNNQEGWGAFKIENMFKGAKAWVDLWSTVPGAFMERSNSLKTVLAAYNPTTNPGHLLIDAYNLVLIHPAQANQPINMEFTCVYNNHPIIGGYVEVDCGASQQPFSTPHRFVVAHLQSDVLIASTLQGFKPDSVIVRVNTINSHFATAFPEFSPAIPDPSNSAFQGYKDNEMIVPVP